MLTQSYTSDEDKEREAECADNSAGVYSPGTINQLETSDGVSIPESTDSEAELELKSRIQLVKFDGEYVEDVTVMQQMGLPLSFFNSPFDKMDKVTLSLYICPSIVQPGFLIGQLYTILLWHVFHCNMKCTTPYCQLYIVVMVVCIFIEFYIMHINKSIFHFRSLTSQRRGKVKDVGAL